MSEWDCRVISESRGTVPGGGASPCKASLQPRHASPRPQLRLSEGGRRGCRENPEDAGETAFRVCESAFSRTRNQWDVSIVLKTGIATQSS